MFVKVVWKGQQEPYFDQKSIYECHRIHVSNPDESTLSFDMENDSGSFIAVHVDKTTPATIYIMSDQGQTVDTYRWPL